MIKHYPLFCRPTRQCTQALSPHRNVSFLLSLTFTVGGQLTQVKNDNKGKPFAAKGWARSLNKGGPLVKDDDYNVCTVCREDKGFENSSLNTVETNIQTERRGKAFAKQTNEQVDKTYGKGTHKTNKVTNNQLDKTYRKGT